MGRTSRQRVSFVIAVVCFVIVAVMLTAIGWLLIRDPEFYDDDEAAVVAVGVHVMR